MDGMSDDGRWLTYAELAEQRGITKASATRMAFRYKWRRQAGNDGTLRVLVPMSAIRDTSDGTPDDKPHGSALAQFTDAVGAVTLAFSKAEATFAATLAAKDAALEVAQAAISAQAQVIVAAEARTAELTQELATARAETQEARQAAEELRQADAARKGQGRLARLRAAWRGE